MSAQGRFGVMRGALWVRDLVAQRPMPGPAPGYVTIPWFDWSETNDAGLSLAAARAIGVSPAELESRRERGCMLFVAATLEGANIAAWVWVSLGREHAPLLARDLRFQGNEAYGWDAGTLPQHRGRGLFVAVLEEAGCWAYRAGLRYLWGGIEDTNLASRHANAAAGYRPVLHVTHWRLGRGGVLRTRPVVYADNRFVERARSIVGA